MADHTTVNNSGKSVLQSNNSEIFECGLCSSVHLIGLGFPLWQTQRSQSSLHMFLNIHRTLFKMLQEPQQHIITFRRHSTQQHQFTLWSPCIWQKYFKYKLMKNTAWYAHDKQFLRKYVPDIECYRNSLFRIRKIATPPVLHACFISA
jgi:hypothetical protein